MLELGPERNVFILRAESAVRWCAKGKIVGLDARSSLLSPNGGPGGFEGNVYDESSIWFFDRKAAAIAPYQQLAIEGLVCKQRSTLGLVRGYNESTWSAYV